MDFCIFRRWYNHQHHLIPEYLITPKEIWMASATHGHEFEEALGDGEGPGNLACCSPWDHKESDMAERLNNTN